MNPDINPHIIQLVKNLTRYYLEQYDVTYDDCTAVDVMYSFNVYDIYKPYTLLITVDYVPLITIHFDEYDWIGGYVDEQIIQAIKNRYHIEEDDI